MSRARPLSELYATLNAEFWDGRLPRPLREPVIGGPVEQRGILVRRIGVCDGVTGLRARGRRHGHCTGLFRPPGTYWPAEIRILSPLGAEQERRTLLHEMAHVAVYVAGHRDPDPHGQHFVEELARLAELGEAWALAAADQYRELAATTEPLR